MRIVQIVVAAAAALGAWWFASPLGLAFIGLLTGVLLAGFMAIGMGRGVAGARRLRTLAVHAAVMTLVVGVMAARHAGEGATRPIARTLQGVHGEGVVGLIGIVVGAVVVAMTVSSRRQS